MNQERQKIAPFEGLRPWLEMADRLGEIMPITEEVDPHLEMSTITSLASRETGGPALLFENIKGHPGHRALFHPIGTSIKRLALAMRETPDKTPLELVKILRDKSKNRIAPKIVAARAAAVNQNVERGEKVDITKFPAQRIWPLDGGIISAPATPVVTRDARRAAASISAPTAMMIKESTTRSGVYYTSPGKDATLDRDKPGGRWASRRRSPRLWRRSAAVSGRGDQLSQNP